MFCVEQQLTKYMTAPLGCAEVAICVSTSHPLLCLPGCYLNLITTLTIIKVWLPSTYMSYSIAWPSRVLLHFIIKPRRSLLDRPNLSFSHTAFKLTVMYKPFSWRLRVICFRINSKIRRKLRFVFIYLHVWSLLFGEVFELKTTIFKL